ncbi:carbonic anhydrase [Clostridium frigoris]|uniref:Carbonic anhydrase n=1 Tax=Clostridium frigoris TaxID=205327 RepID=A0ABS6BP73_9CLOT|nr:carbonic anhydrase [Clostridium frigoris]MBU3158706.1 carbonic anhydrase [Clostridium frigoris]
MDRLIKINTKEDIFDKYKDTPISSLLEYHNLKVPYETVSSPQMLIGMCMDNRKYLRIPNNFAFIIRSGGGTLRFSEFKVSYTIAIGGIKTIALIAHNHCGMVNLMSKREKFIQGLVDIVGWEKQRAEDHFMNFAPMFEIGNEIEFVLEEAKRLRAKYPNILIAPLHYNVDNNLLYLVKED